MGVVDHPVRETWLEGVTVIDWNKISFRLTVDGKPVTTFTELEGLMRARFPQEARA